MRKLLLALIVLAAVPVMMMAGPGMGTPAPNVTLLDTAYVSHIVPGEYSGHVVLLLFWSSG
jgi:hypothetical protein